MSYRIESGIPLPPSSKGGPSKGPDSTEFTRALAQMAVGQSIFVPFGRLEGRRHQSNTMARAQSFGRKYDWTFTSRAVEGGVRLWRVS